MNRIREVAGSSRGGVLAAADVGARGDRRRRLAAALAAGGALLALSLLAGMSLRSDPARAGAFPAPNGRITCESDRGPQPPAQPPPDFSRAEVISMKPDGNDLRVLTHNEVYEFDPAFSPDGNRIAFSSARHSWPSDDVFTMNTEGTDVKKLTFRLADDFAPSYSPDGTKIAFTGSDGPQFNIYVMNADGSGVRRLTTDPENEGRAQWSPDGTQIAFDSGRSGGGDIYVMDAQGGEHASLRRLTTWSEQDRQASWSPDGRQIVFHRDIEPGTASNFEIVRMNADQGDSGPVTRLTDNAANDPNTRINESVDNNPSWSPDGSRIVFHSNRPGDTEVYTINASDGSDVQRITDNPGFDGRCDWGPAARPFVAPPTPSPPQVSAANVPGARTCAARDFRVRIRSDSTSQPQRVTVSLDGRRIRTTRSGSFRVRVPAGRLRPGRHRLTVVATDAAGLRTRRTFEFRVCASRNPTFTG